MNKSVFHTLLIMGYMFALVGIAGAQSVEEARTEYAKGRFVEAANLAQGLDTSEGYALAADSLAIYGSYIAPDSDKADLFRRATELAREAIRLDAANPEAHLQLAHAMGRHAQAIGIFEALNEGYASQIRDAIQDALRLAPGLAAAHLSFAAWHAGVINNGGLFAALLYGARKDEALAHFERAVELAPEEKIVMLEYALGLLALDENSNHGKARALLKHAIKLPSKDAHDRIIHRKAVEQLAALKGE